MARKKNVVPSYLLHKATGQARVRVGGEDHYLGAFGSEESRIKYGKIISQVAGGIQLDPLKHAPMKPDDASGLSVAELLLAFLRHAETYYSKNGKPTAEVDCFRSAMRPVRELFGLIRAVDFSPLNLCAVQQKYVDRGWCRKFVNASTNRIRRIWKWAVSQGLIPSERWTALTSVPGLKEGHTTAPDYEEREAVSDAHIESVRDFLVMTRG